MRRALANEAPPFGAWLKRRRRTLDLTQEELAGRVGCSMATIVKIETGARRPSRQVADLLADALQVSPDERPAFVRLARAAVHEQTSDAMVPGLPYTSRGQGYRGGTNAQHSHPTNLPAQLTSFLGREQQLQEVRKLVGEGRLLTLTGAPGIGKSRLAIEVASTMLGEFPGGVFLVPLAAVTGPHLVAAAITGALGWKDVAGLSTIDVLKERLGDKAILLVLDNFGHLLDAAPLVAELLAACPALQVLVTSREALQLYGEQQFAVPTLTLPSPEDLPCLRGDPLAPGSEDPAPAVGGECLHLLPCYAAVELFVERARAVRPDFLLTSENARVVAAICSRLDGLPLAIELAATRVKLLSPQEILELLDRRMALLRGGARDLPKRHQTLWGALDWSYDLLGEPERAAFARLSAFSGGCTLPAAEAVCNADGDLGDSILEILQSLLNKNLLQQGRGQHGESRVTMLETIREYAFRRLEEAGAADRARRLHAEYYLALAEAAEPEMRRSASQSWLNRLESDHDNLSRALEWAEQSGEVEFGLQLTVSMWWFWLTRGPLTEARKWFDTFLARSVDAPDQLRAKALSGAGQLAWMNLDYPRARRYYEEAASLYRQLGDSRRIAIAPRGLANVARDEGDFTGSQPLYEESLALFRQLGDLEYVGYSLMSMGISAQREGNLLTARSFYEQSLSIWRERHDEHGTATCLIKIGSVEYREGNYASAAARYRESIRLLMKLKEKPGVAEALAALGRVTAAQGDAGRAVRQLSAAEALLRDTGNQLSQEDRTDQDLYLTLIRSQFGAAEYKQAWEDGQAMTMKQAVAFALEEPEPALN